MSTNQTPDELRKQAEQPKATAETLENALKMVRNDRKWRRTIIKVASTRVLLDAIDRGNLFKPDAVAVSHELALRKTTRKGRAEQDQAVVDIARETGKPLQIERLSDQAAFRLLRAVKDPESHGIDPSEATPELRRKVQENCDERSRAIKSLLRRTKGFSGKVAGYPGRKKKK